MRNTHYFQLQQPNAGYQISDSGGDKPEYAEAGLDSYEQEKTQDIKSLRDWIMADQPIGGRDQDRLERGRFAIQLANAIAGSRGSENLVIALNGEWGSGKSSIKNLTLERLRELGDKSPTVIEFNPWLWAGQEQIAEAFFREIGKEIGYGVDPTAASQLAKKWKKYSALFSAGAIVSEGLRSTIGNTLSVLATFAIIGVSFGPNGNLRVITALIGVSLGLIGVTLKWFGNATDKISSWLDARSAAAAIPVKQLKKELIEELRKRDRPILVVMDDIDRLTDSEIGLLFQLVKANADLPNFVFLLLIHRQQVEESLDKIANNKGSEYLEKIIQVGLDVPTIDQTKIEEILMEGLDEIFEASPLSESEKLRWANIFIGGMKGYFTNIRDVRRYLAALMFQVPLFKKNNIFEVNLVDLFGIETLRVFEPALYNHLRQVKSVVTGSRPISDSAMSSRRESINNILSKAPPANIEFAREILVRLFPQVDWLLSGSFGSNQNDDWARDLRICAPENFDRYFYLALPRNELSQADLERLISLAGEREQLVQYLRDIQQQGLLESAVVRLELHKQQIPLASSVPFITALFDIGDELPEKPGATLGSDVLAMRIIYWHLRKEPDEKTRIHVIERALRDTVGLILPISLVRREGNEKYRNENPDFSLIPIDQVQNLQKICIEKIRQASDTGTLFKNSRLASILYRWDEWGDKPDEATQWATKTARGYFGAITMLRAFTHNVVVSSSGDNFSKIVPRIRLSELEKFIPIDELEKEVNQMNHASLKESEQKIILAFQKSLRRRVEGKSEEWDDDLD